MFTNKVFFNLRKYNPNSKVCCHYSAFSKSSRSYNLSEKIKGTFLETWVKYWKNVYADYAGVVEDIYKDCKIHPIRTTFYSIAAGCVYYCSLHNPSETAFRDQLISNVSKLIQVGVDVRNPTSAHHFKWLEQNYNEGVIRRFNLGIFSVLWLDKCSADCTLYKAVCPYLKPKYSTFHKRIIDIGFLDQWWILTSNMKDYDVNDMSLNNM